MMKLHRQEFSNSNFIENSINRTHSLIQANVRENINKYRKLIKFKNPMWVLKQEGGGANDKYRTLAAYIDAVPFGILSIVREEYSCKIHVWSDGIENGNNCFLINVPSSSFEIVEEI